MLVFVLIDIDSCNLEYMPWLLDIIWVLEGWLKGLNRASSGSSSSSNSRAGRRLFAPCFVCTMALSHGLVAFGFRWPWMVLP